jgi:hypothetical protein
MPNKDASEAALSEVVGTVLLLGITVVAFTGLFWAVQERLVTSPPAPNAKFELRPEGPNMTLVHAWGESVSLSRLSIIHDYNNGTRDQIKVPRDGAFTMAPRGSPTAWDLGERVIVTCPAQYTCLMPGKTGGRLMLVDDLAKTVLFQQEV